MNWFQELFTIIDCCELITTTICTSVKFIQISQNSSLELGNIGTVFQSLFPSYLLQSPTCNEDSQGVVPETKLLFLSSPLLLDIHRMQMTGCGKNIRETVRFTEEQSWAYVPCTDAEGGVPPDFPSLWWVWAVGYVWCLSLRSLSAPAAGTCFSPNKTFSFSESTRGRFLKTVARAFP